VGWLRRAVEKKADPKVKVREVSGESRQQFLTLATSFLGRADGEAGAAFDEAVRSALAAASSGAEASALTALASAIRSHDVAITIQELGAVGRSARAFDVHEDDWTFLGSCVQR
jgi:hypothetical protein